MNIRSFLRCSRCWATKSPSSITTRPGVLVHLPGREHSTSRLKSTRARTALAKPRLLPCGVDTSMFYPGNRNLPLLARWNIGATDPVILFMGTIYRFSGLDRLIVDFRTILKRYPQTKLMVVGWGEDEERLQRLAAEHSVSANVVFTGLQPYSLLPEIIRSCDICINPFELNAITRDILPNKVFQYLACGKPLVATRLPGTEHFLSGERDGVLYTSLEEVADRILDLIEDSDRRRK